MSTLTEADWLRIFTTLGVRTATAAKWAPAAASEWQPALFSKGIEDLKAMVPQVLHECEMFERTEESLMYSHAERIREVWPSRFPTIASAVPYVCAPQKLANFVYAGRLGNGDVASGDGWNMRGRSPIMVTGRNAYRHLGALMGQDLEFNPDLIAGPIYGCEAVRRWWEGEIPDEHLSDTVQLRRDVNGPKALGLDRVQALAARMQEVFA